MSVVATLLVESSETGAFPGYRDLFDGGGTIRRIADCCAPVLRVPVCRR